VGASNEYFSGISTKPQIVYVENPTSGTWQVKVYGWNLRPKTGPPSSQKANVTILTGNSTQLKRNPTIISIDAAKSSLKNFVSSKEEDERIGYVVFGSYAELKQSLTYNSSLLITAINNTGQEGGTAINTGMETAKNNLINNPRENSKKVMILLTDGQNDNGPSIVISKANEIKNLNIILFVIGLTGFADSETLSTIATKPEYYYYTPDASGLQSIFEQVREKIVKTYYNYKLSDYFKIVFYNETGNYVYILDDPSLIPLETKEYTIDLNVYC
jgi:uncharacterized protein YegL